MNLNSIIRLKITGNCNRKCFFCHEEGGMSYLNDIKYCNDLDIFIKKITEEFNAKTIAITGGEPLLNPNIQEIFKYLSEIDNIEGISLTTNGTISKSINFWRKLSKYKLKKVNISIPDIINNKEYDLLNNQIKIIKILNKLNIQANINIVIFNDKVFTIHVIETLLKHKDKIKFSITLLPNLNNYCYGISISEEIINDLKLKKIEICDNNFTSNIKTTYSLNGNIIHIKETKKDGILKEIKGLCDSCSVRNECNEGFYAIRIEKKGSDYFARTCILRNDIETSININNFFNSNTFHILKKYYKTNNK